MSADYSSNALCEFHYKTNLSFKLKYPQNTPNNYFHTNNHNWTHFFFSSVVELRKDKTRSFEKLHSGFFCNIAVLNDMKGWKSLVSLRTVLYVPTHLPLQHCQKTYRIYMPLSVKWLTNSKSEKRKMQKAPAYKLNFFQPNKAGLIEGSFGVFFFFWGGGTNLIPLHISRRTYLISI